MNRKDALSHIALLVGGSIVGAEMFLSGCTNAPDKISSALDFSPSNLSYLDEISETILPKTAGSPGAKDVKVAEFMKAMVTDCYDEKNQKIFMEGLGKLNEESDKAYSKKFMELDANQKKELLIKIDKEAGDYRKTKKKEDPEHYFSLFKQLTLTGFFTSKDGATKALRYVAVPGRYEGCIDYKKGDKAWAT